ncbi:MAG TPA: MBL fold metallo-hydrolase [Candidatus Acidoferrum sp.]|nr:MBL fold metallo-hydrolase [Candidatus Acidoferrum sp.]
MKNFLFVFCTVFFAIASSPAQRAGVPHRSEEDLMLSYLGNAGWEITAGSIVILVDPYLSRIRAAAAAPGMPGASKEASDPRPLIGVNDPLIPDTAVIDAHITNADYILVSHSHFDHLMDVPYIAKKTGATVIGTESTTNVMRAHGISDGKLITVKGGEDYSFGSFSLRVIPSLHLALDSKHYFDSGVIPRTVEVPLRRRDLAEGGTLAFLIRMGKHHLLVFGSNNFIENEITGLRPDVLIAGPDIVPFGPPKEETYQYTRRLMRALDCPSEVIPTHWDNFMQPYDASQDEYVKRLEPFEEEIKSACPKTRFIVPKYFDPIVLTRQRGP